MDCLECQFTAIDDATRIRALRIYERHNQASAVGFLDYVVERFPFRIHTVRTDNGHEWQAQFHWHVEDLGMRHVYIKPGKPNLNGKIERSHPNCSTTPTTWICAPSSRSGRNSTTCGGRTPLSAARLPTRC